jgi:hypothetical protein
MLACLMGGSVQPSIHRLSQLRPAPARRWRRVRRGFAASLVWWVASAAGAEALPFEASFFVAGLGDGSAFATATGIATVNGAGPGGHLSSLTLPAGLLSVMNTITPTSNPTSPPPYESLIVTMSNTSGSFARSTSQAPLAGEMAIPGNLRVCLFVNCGSYFDIPLTSGPGTRGVGLSGPPIVRLGSPSVTLEGAAWTTGTASVVTPLGTLSAVGSARGPASASASTALPSGMLRLVTPVKITIRSFLTSQYVPALGVLEIHFVPEPGRSVLLLSGALALAALGAARRR